MGNAVQRLHGRMRLVRCLVNYIYLFISLCQYAIRFALFFGKQAFLCFKQLLVGFIDLFGIYVLKTGIVPFNF
jgi:hypothetical protein